MVYPAAAGFGLLALSALPSRSIVYLIWLAATVLIVMGRRRLPLIAVAIALAEITVPEITVPGSGLPTRYVVIWLSAGMVLFVGLVCKRRIWLGPGTWPMLLAQSAFVVLVIVASGAGLKPELTSSAARYFFTALLAMILIPAVIDDEKDLQLVGALVIGLLALSAVASFLQAHGSLPGFAVDGNGKFMGRTQGLTDTPITLALQMTVGSLVAWGLATAPHIPMLAGRLSLLALPVFTFGWYYTLTRSVLIALAGGVVATVPFLRGRVRLVLLLAVLGGGPFFFVWITSSESRYTDENLMENGRLALWQAGYFVAIDNPVLGIGYDSYTLVAPLYFERLNLSDEMYSKPGLIRELEQFDVHNDFLRVWHSFGTPALLVYLFLLLAIATACLRANSRAQRSWMQGASLGCFGALVGYMIHSGFHNSMDSTILLWVLAGFSLALLKVSSLTAGSTSDRAVPAASDN